MESNRFPFDHYMRNHLSGTRYVWLICGLLGGVSMGATSGLAEESTKPELWNTEREEPVIAAHYMPWFSNPHTAETSNSGWKHWGWNGNVVKHDPESRDEEGRRDIASTLYPLIGPYSSNRSPVIRYHMETAKAAGIDAFVVIWYGPGTETDQVVPLLLEIGNEAGIKICLCYEEKVNWPEFRQPNSREEIVQSVVADLSYVLDRYSSHPAYLTRVGDPVLFQFNYWGEDALGPKNVRPAEWDQVFASLSRKVAYVRQNHEEGFHPTIPARYLWFTPDESLIERFTRSSLGDVETGTLSFFVTMAAPEFNDSGVNGWGGGSRITPGAGLSLFDDTLRRAWQGNPEMIQLVTWNDFNEGTSIEPSLEHGFRYLDALEVRIGEKTGRAVDLSNNRLPFHRYYGEASEAEKREIPAASSAVVGKESDLTVEISNYLETIE